MSEAKSIPSVSNFDVVIVGGGPVGLITALLLCQRDFKVALVDRLDYKDVLKSDFDGRTFAYAYGSRLILERAGLWDDLKNVAEPIYDIFVTAENHRSNPGDLDLSKGLHYEAASVFDGLPPQNTPAMGYNIETRHFRRTVFDRLQINKNFTLFAPSNVQDIQFLDGSSKVVLDDRILKASLVMACDGKNSWVRAQAGLTSRDVPYEQKALVCLLTHDKPHGNIAYEHFLKSGPLAILPMQKKADGTHQTGCIWSLKNDRADHYYTLSDQDLALELESHFGGILGSISLQKNRWLFPLEMTLVKNITAPRLVLIGDAAHAIHPVAGQGFNLGLRDAENIADHLEKARDLGLDLGSKTLLDQYAKTRKRDILSMSAMCHGLVSLFSNDQKSLGRVRSMGLQATNALPFLKKTLTKHAMGL